MLPSGSLLSTRKRNRITEQRQAPAPHFTAHLNPSACIHLARTTLGSHALHNNVHCKSSQSLRFESSQSLRCELALPCESSQSLHCESSQSLPKQAHKAPWQLVFSTQIQRCLARASLAVRGSPKNELQDRCYQQHNDLVQGYAHYLNCFAVHNTLSS